MSCGKQEHEKAVSSSEHWAQETGGSVWHKTHLEKEKKKGDIPRASSPPLCMMVLATAGYCYVFVFPNVFHAGFPQDGWQPHVPRYHTGPKAMVCPADCRGRGETQSGLGPWPWSRLPLLVFPLFGVSTQYTEVDLTEHVPGHCQVLESSVPGRKMKWTVLVFHPNFSMFLLTWLLVPPASAATATGWHVLSLLPGSTVVGRLSNTWGAYGFWWKNVSLGTSL